MTVAAQVAWSSPVLVPLTPRDSDSAAESAHPRVKTAVVEWSRSCAQSCACHQTGAPPAVSLQQHGGRSPQSLWLWVQPLSVLPWKWPVQGQGESMQPLWELTVVLNEHECMVEIWSCLFFVLFCFLAGFQNRGASPPAKNQPKVSPL